MPDSDRPEPTEFIQAEEGSPRYFLAGEDEIHDIPEATWASMTHRAESENPIRQQNGAESRLWVLGNALYTGGEIPESARKWLGKALVDIANGASAGRALGVVRPKGRPVQVRNAQWRAVNMLFLVETGLNQEQAAQLLCEWGRDDGGELRPYKAAHNNLRKRRGPFARLRSSRVIHSVICMGRLEIRQGLPPLEELLSAGTNAAVQLNYPGESISLHIHKALIEARLAEFPPEINTRI